MSQAVSEADPLDELIEDFLARQRRGERPDAAEYAASRPELAKRIRELFPALATLEELGSVVGDGTRPGVGAAIGDQLGDYRLLREIGRGGMGVVFEAVQETLGRRVALKVLADRGVKGDNLARFQREARTSARLHHTNIVPVFGVGAERGVFFYAMQYIDGHSLAERIDETRRARAGSTIAAEASTAVEGAAISSIPRNDHFRSVARLGLQAAEALAYAHSQGVLHRDIKPSNLLIDAEETLWIADFGLAKDLEHEDLTGTGQILGTLRYMAPERFKGEADARSDVYALGATLFEAVALRAAFPEQDRLALAERITKSGAVPLRNLEPSVPADLDVIVGKALAREPRDRYQDPAAMAEDLRAFLADQPIKAKRPGPVGLAKRWCRRNPVVAALAFGVFSLLAALTVVTAIKNRDLAGLLEERNKALAEAQSSAKEARENLWQSLRDQAKASISSLLPGSRANALEALGKAAGIRQSLELSGLAIRALERVDLERLPVRETSERIVPSLVFDGIRRDGRNVRVAKDPVTGIKVELRPDENPFWVIQTSFDDTGTRWLTHCGSQLVVRSWPGGGIVAEMGASSPFGSISAPSWTRDGKIACLTKEGRFLLFNPATKELEADWIAAESMPGGVELSYDGTLAALRRKGQTHVDIHRVADGKRIAELEFPHKCSCLAWGRRSNRFAAGTAAGHIHFWGIEYGAAVRQGLAVFRAASMVGSALFLEDDRLMAAAVHNREIALLDTDTGEIITREDAPANFLCHDPSTRTIGWGGLPRYRLRMGEGAFVVNRAVNKSEFDFLPDNKTAVTYTISGGDTGLCVWDLERVRLIRTLPLKESAGFASVLPDGSLAFVGPNLRIRKFVPGQMPDWEPPTDFASPSPVPVARRIVPTGRDGSLLVTPVLAPFMDPKLKQGIQEFRSFEVFPGNAARPRPLQMPLSVDLTLDPLGRYFVGVSGSHALVVDFASGKGVRALEKPHGLTAVFSWDGAHLAISGPEGTSVWRVADWTRVALHPSAADVRTHGACFHPNGKSYFTASEQGLDWRLMETHEIVLTIPTPYRIAGGLGISRDGRFLVASGNGLVAWELPVLRKRLREMNLDWDD